MFSAEVFTLLSAPHFSSFPQLAMGQGRLARQEDFRLITGIWQQFVFLPDAHFCVRFRGSRAIERYPNNEKYRRVFKGRVKFRKHVGTVRNARQFMQASGWVEVRLGTSSGVLNQVVLYFVCN